MKTLRLETTAPFQGLAELVAYDEGLFEREGVQIEWMDREKGLDKSPQLHITDHKDASRYTSHGRMMESGQADLYNACEWGNFSRVETTNVGSRQVGRRSMVNFAGIGSVGRRLRITNSTISTLPCFRGASIPISWADSPCSMSS